MTWQGTFKVIIRLVFIFAYIAFLAASIRHVATFFHNFEEDATDWVNPYTLAVSIDLTALVLTVGVMFFRQNMPWYAQGFVWLFIVCLTAFSWFVNWEYAMTYQGNSLKVGDTLRMLNPILASSFAFLNLAYSVVAEFFSKKAETAAELAAKVNELEQREEQEKRLAAYRERNKKTNIIQRTKNTVLEVKNAAVEVIGKAEIVETPLSSSAQAAAQSTAIVPDNSANKNSSPEESQIPGGSDALSEQNVSTPNEQEPDTDPEVEAFTYSEQQSGALGEYNPFGEEDEEADIEANDFVHPEKTPLPRITGKLSEQIHDASTLYPVNKKVRSTSKATDAEKKKRVERIVKKNPNIKPTELAEKAKVSRSYASEIRTKVLADIGA